MWCVKGQGKDGNRISHCTDIHESGLTHSFQQSLSNFPNSLGHSILICKMKRMEYINLSHFLLPSNVEIHKLANDGVPLGKGHVSNTDLGPGIYIFLKVPQVVSQVWGSLLKWRRVNIHKGKKNLPLGKIQKFIWETQQNGLSERSLREALKARRVLHSHEARRHCTGVKTVHFCELKWQAGAVTLSATHSGPQTRFAPHWGPLSKKALSLSPPFSCRLPAGHFWRVSTSILQW